MRSFLESRMPWPAYTSDIAGRIPPKAVLSTFTGKVAGPGGKSKGGGTFDLAGTAPLAPDGSIPREIGAFLNAIPKDPLWNRDFASVATDIKLPLSGKKEQAVVAFSIIGACKASKSGGK